MTEEQRKQSYELFLASLSEEQMANLSQTDKMNYKESELLLKNYREIQDATAVTIKINQDQVVDIVVGDLLGKYKYCKTNNNPKADAFETVLRHYLTADDFAKLTNPTQPEN